MTSDVMNTDCLEYMRSLPDKAFQLAIADPPYGDAGQGFTGEERFGGRFERYRKKSVERTGCTWAAKYEKKIAGWDVAPTQEFFDELERVSVNRIIWGANYFGLQGGMLVWDKMNGTSDQYGCEIAFQSFDSRTDIVHYMWQGMFQGEVCSVDINKANRQKGNKALNEERIHPTQKPVALYAWLLQHYAKEGDTIFDPMMGSQSSRIAAYKMGFDYVGCELDKEYFAKGCERFDRQCRGITIGKNGKHYQQTVLF
jgi:site-specific DNA-methyltransferase (adenine-specific)